MKKYTLEELQGIINTNPSKLADIILDIQNRLLELSK